MMSHSETVASPVELLPCLNCLEVPVIKEVSGCFTTYYWVGCAGAMKGDHNCEAFATSSSIDTESAARRWNRKISESALPLKCPFCGQEAEIEEVKALYPGYIGGVWQEVFWKIGCLVHFDLTSKEAFGCGIVMSGWNKEELIKKWNTRVQS